MEEEDKQEKLLTMAEVAKLLGFTVDEVRERAEFGRIRFEKREGNEYWFTNEALIEYERRKWWELHRRMIALAVAAIFLLAAGGAHLAVRHNKRIQSENLVKKAETHIRKGELKPALDTLKLAVVSNPNNLKARLVYARALGLAGQKELQKEQLDAALKKSPDSIETLQALGVLEISAGDPDAAEKIFGKIIKLEPDHFMANYYLGMIHGGKGDTRRAAEYARKVLKLKPDFAPAEVLLADIFVEENKFKEAAKLYGKNKNTGLATLLNKAVALHKQGDFKQAAPLYREIIENEPVIARAYNNLAWELVSGGTTDKKNLEQAFNLARKALLLNPEDATAADTMGWILRLAGRNKEALEQFDRAIKLDSELGVAHFHRGVTLMEMKKNKDALEAFKSAQKSAAGESDAEAVEVYIKKLEKK